MSPLCLHQFQNYNLERCDFAAQMDYSLMSVFGASWSARYLLWNENHVAVVHWRILKPLLCI